MNAQRLVEFAEEVARRFILGAITEAGFIADLCGLGVSRQAALRCAEAVRGKRPTLRLVRSGGRAP